jgi:arylsulfatase A-like enzyme
MAAGHRRVILVLLDAARSDRFRSYGYDRETTPNIAELAERGVVFLHHYSQGTATRTALPTLLYSRYFVRPIFPYSRRVPFADPEDLFHPIDAEAISLPAALAADGFKTAMISAHSWTLPDSSMGRQFDEVHHLPQILEYPPHQATPSAELVIDYTLEWVDANAGEDFFLYLHMMDTHFPHFYGKEAKRFLPPAELAGVDRSRFEGQRHLDYYAEYSADDVEFMNALYDGSLRYADRHLGRLFDHLRDMEALDSTLISLTSDHGEHLLEHPNRWDHAGPWYENVARVPWIVFSPERLQPARVAGLSEGVDVMPTLLGTLGVKLPEGKRMDGVDRTRFLSGEPPPRELAFGTSQAALRGARYKVLFESPAEDLLARTAPDVTALSGELYDLEVDPGERFDLWSERPDVVAEMLDLYRRELSALHERFSNSVSTAQPDGAFAIAARFLDADRDVPVADTATAEGESNPLQDESGGWIRSNHWQNHQIFGRPGAIPLTLRVRVPDGPYAISVALSGAGRFRLPGQEVPVAFDTGLDASFDPGRRPASKEMDFDVTHVRDQTFSLWLEPLKDAPLMLRYVGFVPLSDLDQDLPPEDVERLERLRSLGYVQ